MRSIFATINQNCRLAARMISDADERLLSRLERFGLAAHLITCRSCRRYKGQIHLLNKLVQVVCPQDHLEQLMPDDARRRIQHRLLRITQ